MVMRYRDGAKGRRQRASNRQREAALQRWRERKARRDGERNAWAREQPREWVEHVSEAGVHYQLWAAPLTVRVEHDGHEAKAKPEFVENVELHADLKMCRVLARHWAVNRAKQYVTEPEDIEALDRLHWHWNLPRCKWRDAKREARKVVKGLSCQPRNREWVRNALTCDLLRCMWEAQFVTAKKVQRLVAAVRATPEISCFAQGLGISAPLPEEHKP